MTAAPQSAATPPVMWTTPEPAKSIMPPRRATLVSPSPAELKAESQPPDDHTQWTTTGYTNIVIAHVYTRYAPSCARSATAPETIVAAAAANTYWNHQPAQLPPLGSSVEPWPW